MLTYIILLLWKYYAFPFVNCVTYFQMAQKKNSECVQNQMCQNVNWWIQAKGFGGAVCVIFYVS